MKKGQRGRRRQKAREREEVRREGEEREGKREGGERVGTQPCHHVKTQNLSQTDLPDTFPVGHKTVSGSAFTLSICTEDGQEMGKGFAHGAKK